MRIFVLSGTNDCDNLGDLAMLQIALQRLKMLWPDAAIRVLTAAPAKLEFYCPGVEPVPWHGCKRWLRVAALPRFFFPEIRPEIRRQFPIVRKNLPALARLLFPSDGTAARKFADALFSADLLVLSGCGMITDAFCLNALRVLDTFEAAIRCGIPTVMLGQGFGPIQGEKLFRRAAQVLPRVGAIFIRESSASLPLLQKLGVPEEKTFLTGDDAVEFAFREKRAASGGCLGVNLRLASYASLNADILGTVRMTLAEKARLHRTTLTGVPILIGQGNSDVQTLRQLIGGEGSGEDLDTPLKAVRQISNCRVVVTGSYHAGVFALARGIPIVGIVQSDYYRDKFYGLASEFGEGCTVLRADDAEFSKKLGTASDELWMRADDLKTNMLSAAERQVSAAQTAYARLPGLLWGKAPLPRKISLTNPQANPAIDAARTSSPAATRPL